MLESDFQHTLLSVLRAQGLRALGIVEADISGPADVVVWSPATAVILGWLELKVDDEALRPSQVEFLRDRDRETGNAFVVRFIGNTGILSIERPPKADWTTNNRDLMVLHRTASVGTFDWAAFFVRWKRSRR